MKVDVPPELIKDIINNSKHHRLSSDKLCFQIARNIFIHRSPEGQTFLSLPSGPDARMTFSSRSPIAADIITDRYIQETAWPPNPRSVSKALRAREAMAQVGYQDTFPVFLRVAGYGYRFTNAIPKPTRIILDLCNHRGDVITIDPDGWKMEPGGDYFLLRHHHMNSLPVPPQTNPQPPFNKVPAQPQEPSKTKDILTRFRSLLNPATDKDFHRMLIWLLSAARGSGPVPVLAIEGPATSGKSTATHFLRQAIDPSQGVHADHTARNRDLFEYAVRNWVVTFESVRKLTPRVTDFINSLAGGVTCHVREPYDRHDPVALFLQRPIIMNIQDGDPISKHGDSLPNRTLRTKLAPLAPEDRNSATELAEEFKQLQPELLALLCTALAMALKNLGVANPKKLPALADAALWAIAAAPALGLTEAQILAAFDDEDPEPDQDPSDGLQSFMSDKQSWTGTATELHELLPTAATPKLLAQKLRRLTIEGLEITFPRTGKKRLIEIKVGRTPRSARVPLDPPRSTASDADSPIPPSLPTATPLTLTATATSTPNTISYKITSSASPHLTDPPIDLPRRDLHRVTRYTHRQSDRM